MKQPNTLGDAIKAHRLALGISQHQLARMTVVDPSYINLIERGRRVPVETVLRRIETALGVEAGGLMKMRLGLSDKAQALILMSPSFCAFVNEAAGTWQHQTQQVEQPCSGQ